MSTQICIGLADVVLWTKILGNRAGILASVLIVINCFFRCQKSTSNLEMANACYGNFFVYHVTGSTIYLLQNSFSSYVSLKDIYKTLTELEKWIWMGINNFVKSVLLLSLHKEKKMKLSKLVYCSSCGKTWVWGGGSKKSTPLINLESDMP